ncbi:solute carrier family 35 member G1-like [Hydractinia symbiolongicarpus]|uniref:solute carrier family 35 member G1-like n=1 Tax=Hydractinia symbiolongicarpus TaxID=13093 RepID=UPI00254C74D1|nr:solute carrier family 35 member G1-like [Hydractinia symbiolongicarpus]
MSGIVDTTHEENTTTKLPRRRVYGLVLMSLGGFYVVLSNVLVQLIHQHSYVDISSVTLLYMRSLFTTFLAVLVMFLGRVHPAPSRSACFKLTILGLAGVGGILFMYLALAHMPVGDVTIIQFTAPFFTTILSVLFLSQKLTFVDVICGVFSFLGLLIMTRPTLVFGEEDIDSREISECITGESDVANAHNHSDYMLGAFYALLGSVLVSIFYILSKICGKQGDVMLIIFYTGLVGMLLPTGVNLVRQQPYVFGHQWDIWILLMLIGLLSFVHLMFVAESLQFEEAGPVALVRNADCVYAFVLQYTILGVVPKPLTLMGATMVVIATTCMGGYRYYCAKKQQSFNQSHSR